MSSGIINEQLIFGNHCYGSIDKLIINRDSVIVIEYKNKNKVYNGDINQVQAYAHCISSYTDKNIKCEIINFKNNVLYKANYDRSIEKQIHKVQKMILAKYKMNRTRNINKCRNCEYQKQCNPNNSEYRG